jgi:hypothetical protein
MLRLRYGIALSVVLLVVGVVVIARVSSLGRHDTTVHQAGIDDGGGARPAASPSTRPGAPIPSSIARSFARTWIASLPPTTWRRQLARYSTTLLSGQFAGVDPDRVPAHTLTGVPSMTSTARSYVVIDVPTDAGILILGLRATDGEWLVDSVDWTRE